jgi:hypothetical protein
MSYREMLPTLLLGFTIVNLAFELIIAWTLGGVTASL